MATRRRVSRFMPRDCPAARRKSSKLRYETSEVTAARELVYFASRSRAARLRSAARLSNSSTPCGSSSPTCFAAETRAITVASSALARAGSTSLADVAPENPCFRLGHVTSLPPHLLGRPGRTLGIQHALRPAILGTGAEPAKGTATRRFGASIHLQQTAIRIVTSGSLTGQERTPIAAGQGISLRRCRVNTAPVIGGGITRCDSSSHARDVGGEEVNAVAVEVAVAAKP